MSKKCVEKFLLGEKVGMTQVFKDDGKVVPVTVLYIKPSVVVGVKTVENDGYDSIMVGYGEVKHINKPNEGLYKKHKIAPKKHIKEFRVSKEFSSKFNIGQTISIEDMFAIGDSVDVKGISKGKGFQGNIKRHGQSRGPETHGSTYHRRVGSMGANSYPARVFKGKKLPGHMGNVNITVQNLEVVGIDSENNLMWVKGGVPGPNGSWITVINSVKR